VSSSSSATERLGPVGELLAASFAMLAAELPAAHDRMCARLSGRAVEIRVGGERLLATFGPAGARVVAVGEGEEGEAPGVSARIAASRGAILDVLDARRSIAEAVLADEVEVLAPIDELVELMGGLRAYVHGAVRCPSFPRLLARFRAACAEVEAGPGA
jgi:hypothetical protein